jgi:predicted DNA-binding transcriptional regulator AlpA
MTPTHQLRFVRYKDLKMKGIMWTRVHVDRLEKDSKFPKRVHLGPATIAWVESEIDAFVACKIAERDTRAQPPGPEIPSIAA